MNTPPREDAPERERIVFDFDGDTLRVTDTGGVRERVVLDADFAGWGEDS